MPVYYPDVHIEEDDCLVAVREEGWGRIGENLGIDSNITTITMQFHGRADRPNDSDSFDTSVNNQDQQVVHIDTISDITGIADQYALYRNGGR